MKNTCYNYSIKVFVGVNSNLYYSFFIFNFSFNSQYSANVYKNYV